MNFLEEIARTDFQDLLIKGKKTKTHFVINSSDKTTTIFLFQEKLPHPFGVLRVSTGMNNVEREFNILKILTQEGNEGFSQSVPRPYNLHSFGKQKLASFSYMHGAPMIPKINKRSCVKDHFERVRRWLVALANIPVPDFLIEKSTQDDFALRCDCVLKAVKNPEPFLIDVLKRVKASEELLKNKKTPLAINHNDLAWSNIFLIKDQIGVVDWEAARARWPVIEWFFFIFTYTERLLSCDKKAPEFRFKMLHETFFKKNWLSQIAFSETSKLLEDLSLDEKLIFEFYFLGIFDYAYRRFWYDRSMVNRAIFLFENKNNIFYKSRSYED